MGQEKHRALTQAFYKKALGVFLVYDVTQRSSFEQLDYYYKEMENNSTKETQVVLVGNKIDLQND
jgi:GTPase SAR1 family protein